MSELQLTLIGVGAALLLAVWGFNRLQEWRWHRMARSTLGTGARPDVLLGEEAPRSAKATAEAAAARDEPPFAAAEAAAEATAEASAQGSAEATAEQPAGDVEPPAPALQKGSGAPSAAVPEEAPEVSDAGLIQPPREDLVAPPDEGIEYLVTLGCSAPLTGVELWQNLARASSPVRGARWLGRRVTDGGWCVVQSDSELRFDSLRAALLLANRSGPVSELDIERFCSLVSAVATTLKLRVEFPPRAPALERAEVLDAFCAEVDIVVGINVVISATQPTPAGRIARWAESHGMTLGRDGAFHLCNAHGHTVWRLVNRDPRPFLAAGLANMTVSGVTFLLDVPLVEAADERLSPMFDAAATLARELGARVLDDNGAALGPQQLGRIARELTTLLARMEADGIPAGGERARRLFAV